MYILRSLILNTLIFICTLGQVTLLAESRDTILNMVLSKPYFYNLIKSTDGKIFAGTSEGIMEIVGMRLLTVSDAKGYITTDLKGRPVIDSSGIRYYKEKKYVRLLPYPDVSREEYHVSAKNQFYICSGGLLYFFDLPRYEISYPYHSIRSISKNIVGTYSGVYVKGKKLEKPGPTFTDGYIREFGNKAFICNYSIFIVNLDALPIDATLNSQNYHVYDTKDNLFFNDIFPSRNNKAYYLATGKKLLLVDSSFTRDSVLFTHDNDETPINLITGNPFYLFFTAGKQLYSLEYKTGTISPVVKVTENILGGVYQEQQIFILTSKALYRFNSGSKLEHLVNLESAHTLELISGSELIISTDQGLYLFNIASKSLSVVIKGVEFNRKALFRDENNIYAGSVNGLYKIRVEDVPLIIEDNHSNRYYEEKWYDSYLVPVAVFFLIPFMGIFIFMYRRRWKAAEETIEHFRTPVEQDKLVSKEVIEAHIQNNLSTASINMLKAEFNLNSSQLYSILKPEKPGSIIQRIRLNTFIEMRARHMSYKEISEATGLSISYLKRIKQSD